MNLHAKKKSHERLNYVSKMSKRRRSKITKYLFLATTHNGWGVKRSYSNVLRRLLLIFLQPGVFFRLIVKDTTCRFQNATKNRHFNFNMRKFSFIKKIHLPREKVAAVFSYNFIWERAVGNFKRFISHSQLLFAENYKKLLYRAHVSILFKFHVVKKYNRLPIFEF